MSRSIGFNFSQVFDGVIWNTLCVPENHIILIEIRNSEKKKVKFSAFNFETFAFLWKDKVLDESWWVNLNAVSGNVVLFTVFTDTTNPDKKGIVAYDLHSFEVLWWNNDFSLISFSTSHVTGISNKFGNKELSLELLTGREIKAGAPSKITSDSVLKSSLYLEEQDHFITVKTFLAQRFNLLPITALEYLEYQSLIFISCYLQEDGLTNYLFIISEDGNLLLKEKLDEHVKGIGLDTFFILSGCVFFVRNKVELVSYKIL